mmetsp:Transcript_5377/g.20070  ORF Transcript_5377/g.20070 Transcript_5377/m.20070 type:complete len:196 (-) Transcript_5377:78-665(-)|eukprot:CAMPEP_0117444376 /NCGR_PEP_ID=MMETSP0759-20121206/5209_1 /TAXON_ID=63605 /ORGANISM="Percolomonas cosmopolitus, Strain WS" /LENGTH=195 /DNA_ID=CAMNT_0005236441 /DNA_START=247 /DNA_END=834 /DNA_ORIENTATION=+
MTTDSPRPLILCAPSGTGKSTLIGRLQMKYPDAFAFSVSHTTRTPREGEINGVHYHFVEKESFQAMIEKGEFIEHAFVHGNHYGTSFEAVRTCGKNKQICILDIDIQGMKQVVQSDLNPLCVFVNPPSLQILEKRLRGRNTETEESIQLRLKNAAFEIEESKKCDCIHEFLENNDLDQTTESLTLALQNYYAHLN